MGGQTQTRRPADTGPIEPGQAAPSFTLNDQSGQPHSLSDYRGRWVVLYFYPKDNTPGCTKEACQFRDDESAFERRGAAVLGVSPDSEQSHQKFADKFDLPFTLLSDPDKTVCQQYGAWGEKMSFGKKLIGLVRTTYLIDPQGKVAHRWDKVKVASHADDVLGKLDELAGS